MSLHRDQLYFDRVHPVVPCIHRARYLTLKRPSPLQGSRASLSYAMWTLATALSLQYRDIQQSLYFSARRSLEQIKMSDAGMSLVSIELAQGWILIAIYEFINRYYHRAWMSAGRAIRLVQLMDLHQAVAASSHDESSVEYPHVDWTVVEESRRTFWMAFVLDRFVSGRHEWPLAMNEQAVCQAQKPKSSARLT